MTFFAQAATPNPRMKKRVPNPSENTATLQHLNTPPKKRKKEAKKERGDIYPYGVIYIPPKTNSKIIQSQNRTTRTTLQDCPTLGRTQ